MMRALLWSLERDAIRATWYEVALVYARQAGGVHAFADDLEFRRRHG